MFECWLPACQAGITLLNSRLHANSKVALGHCRNLSLIELHEGGESQIGYFYWSRVAGKLGLAHRVTVDRRTQVINYVPVMPVGSSLGAPHINLKSMVENGRATLIHVDIGVTMVKPHDFREKIPEGILKLQHVWACGSGGSLPLSSACYICGKDHGIMIGCPVCETTSHVDCATRLSTSGVMAKHTLPVALEHAIPSAWRLCAVCDLAFSRRVA